MSKAEVNNAEALEQQLSISERVRKNFQKFIQFSDGRYADTFTDETSEFSWLGNRSHIWGNLNHLALSKPGEVQSTL